MNKNQIWVIAYILGFTLYGGVKAMLREQQIYSNSVGSVELTKMYTKMFGEMIYAKLEMKTDEEIQAIFRNHMAFIQTVINS